ncbi:hypothetical protein CEQ21_07150 (plasmid) [Niallia circulans]|uniref:Uncharacterized protein n=1 Tax=Niallia circulans TaxID=1397 RepID=A0A553SQR4_NIACI|nr:hypothetical protein [Niallia circulans]TRZ39330.1 hypothetical protein CEQ21_07150 [Niallia circulans]
MREELNYYAGKFGNGNEKATDFIKAVLFFMAGFTLLMNYEICQKGIKQLVLSCFGSENLWFYGMVTLDYGLCLLLYVYSVGLGLIVLTHLISKHKA